MCSFDHYKVKSKRKQISENKIFHLLVSRWKCCPSLLEDKSKVTYLKKKSKYLSMTTIYYVQNIFYHFTFMCIKITYIKHDLLQQGLMDKVTWIRKCQSDNRKMSKDWIFTCVVLQSSLTIIFLMSKIWWIPYNLYIYLHIYMIWWRVLSYFKM